MCKIGFEFDEYNPWKWAETAVFMSAGNQQENLFFLVIFEYLLFQGQELEASRSDTGLA